MAKLAYLYCDKRSLNEATNYYIGIIRECLEEFGYFLSLVHKLSEINNPSLIFTITERYFLIAKIRHPFIKTIYWAQGIGAEEAKINAKGIKNRLRYILRRVAEPIAVKKTSILFCVSRRMVEYFKKTYGLKNHGQIIVMPCYNLQLGEQGNLIRYDKPTFIYAGNTSSWQCIDIMLDVYAEVERTIPEAKLTIYSKNKAEFTRLINERGIKNYSIKFVEVSQLQQEISSYKYGFVIRDNHIVNQVATPTKLNSYLSSFLIPIYSDGVADFAENIDLGEFDIMANCPLNSHVIAQQIIKFETIKHDFSQYPSVVAKVFDNHYNTDKYKREICEVISKILIM